MVSCGCSTRENTDAEAVTSRFPPAVMAGLLLLATACAGAESPRPVREVLPTSSSVAPASTPPNPAEVGANELGLVPVLMYHRLVARPESVYDRTPRDFRAELERLAREDYVPVTAAELTAGRVDIPAGTHPVVLTFDDGDPTQFALTPDGEPAPGTAVAILREVARAHPGFRAAASFYVNENPFGDPGGRRTLPWLVANGMEVGNHTATHANLASSTPEVARAEIRRGDQAIRRAAPHSEPVTLALPFGAQPEPAGLALRGPGYRYRGAFLVGANPAPSPYGAEFDPAGIPRIRSQGATGPEAEVCSTVWLDKLAATPARRYTSDGVPERISVPRGAGTPAPVYRDRVLTY
jgi:peptidoglycan/xylan/chitin deacetylase (PgdA/CDA1 family)